MKRSRLAILVLAVLSALAARAVHRWLLGDFAHVMDEIAYLFQAKVFATGHVSAPALDPPAAFNMWFVDDRGARTGIFPPGFPFVLASFLRFGFAPWANPVLHGVTVVVLSRSGERLAGPTIGLLVAALYAMSPQAILLAATFMSHTLVALTASVVLLYTVDLAFAADTDGPGSHPTRSWSLVTGAALGITAATRPLCAVVLAASILVAGFLLPRGRTNLSKYGGLTVVLIALGALPFVLGLLAFNAKVTGSPLRFPQMAYFDAHLPPGNVPFFRYRPGCNALGFGPGRGCDLTTPETGHSLGNALSNLGDNLDLWLRLAVSPLLPIFVVVAFVRKEWRRVTWFLLGVPLVTFGLYALYWHGGSCYGARFYQVALPALMLLVALGIGAEHRRLLTAALVSIALWNGFAWTAIAREVRAPDWGYWGTDDRFRELRERWSHGRAVVMVAFDGDDIHNPPLAWTSKIPGGGMWMLNIRSEAALAENEPWPDDGPLVFAKFHPALVPELTRRFPGRGLYLYEVHRRRVDDVIAPFDPAAFPPKAYGIPAPNFDGFRVAPPTLPQPWMFQPEADSPR